MAVDAAILEAVSAGDALPTLRLYGWERPCVSLGYGQHVGDVDLEQLNARGWDIVRRPTGGKAILHTDELTYSVALPIEHPLAQGGVVESYREISKALLAALRTLGTNPQADRKTEGGEISVVCFETPSHYEITVNGKKLVGSAQVRRKAGVLQHGTLPLYGDIARICDVLQYEDEDAREQARRQVRERATTLAEALPSLESSCQPSAISSQEKTSASCWGKPVHEETLLTPVSHGQGNTGSQVWRVAAEAVAHGFEEAFGIEFVVVELTDTECDRAARLEREMYGNPEWTMRR
jgi:lipoate-protein ligase A